MAGVIGAPRRGSAGVREFAGYAIPQRARPVLLAIGDRNGPIFHRTPPTPALTTPHAREPPLTGLLEHSDLKAHVAVVLGHLMFGRARSVSNTALPANVREPSRL